MSILGNVGDINDDLERTAIVSTKIGKISKFWVKRDLVNSNSIRKY